jgi:excisionase family DNA binding protein
MTAIPADQPRKARYTVTEAARILGVSRRTVYRLIEDGSVEAVRVRATLRIARDDLEDYIKTNQHDPWA